MRQHGFRIAFDRLGDGDLPLVLLADAGPDMVKLDVRLLRELPRNPAAVAVIEALAHVSTRTGRGWPRSASRPRSSSCP